MKDQLLKQALGDRMKQSFGGITIEIKPIEDGEEEQLKKEGLAPALKEKDAQIQSPKGEQTPLLNPDDMNNDEEMLVDEMIKPDAQDDYIMQAMKGEKPRGLKSKIEQMMVAKKVEKKQKGGNA